MALLLGILDGAALSIDIPRKSGTYTPVGMILTAAISGKIWFTPMFGSHDTFMWYILQPGYYVKNSYLLTQNK